MCGSRATVGQTLTVFSYRSEGGSWIRGPPTPSVQLLATDVKGDGVPVMWQNSDAEALGRAYAQTKTTGTVVMTSSSTLSSNTGASSPASSTSPWNTDSGGLSTGSKIGLGVGIPVAVLLGLLVGFLLWRRRQTQRETGAVYQDQQPPEQYPRAELEHKGIPEAPVYYAHEQAVHEIHSTPEAYHSRHELPDVHQR